MYLTNVVPNILQVFNFVDLKFSLKKVKYLVELSKIPRKINTFNTNLLCGDNTKSIRVTINLK